MALIRWQLPVPPNEKADVVAGEIAYGERPHGKAEVLGNAVDLLGRGPFLQQELGLVRVELQHAVADEAVAVAGEHRDLPEALAELHHADDCLRRAARATHILQQLHDIRWTEEMRAHDALWPGRGRGNRIDIQGRGVGREDGVRRGVGIELGENAALDLQVLERRLDNQIGACQRCVRGRAPNATEQFVHSLASQAAARHGARVVAANRAQTFIDGLLGDIHQHYGNSGVRNAHRNAAAHRPRTDNAYGSDGHRFHVGGNVRNAARLALGKEYMHERRALRTIAALVEPLPLEPESILLRASAAGLDAVDDFPGCELTPRFGCNPSAKRCEARCIYARDTC